MKVSLRLLSVMLSISLTISVISFSWPGRTASAAQAGEGEPIPGELSSDADTPVNGTSAGKNDITSSAGSSSPPVSPEARPSEENTIEDALNTESGGSISGHVYQSDGVTPIDGASVYARLSGDFNSLYAFTDANGSYEISQLPGGNYIVWAYAAGYFLEYYLNVENENQATHVAIEDSITTSGIDFTLYQGSSISGHVYQADGISPISGASVFIGSAEGDIGNIQSTASDGSYLFSGLPPRRYLLEVSAVGYMREYYNGTCNVNLATYIQAGEEDNITDIDFTLETGGSISGHVYQADGATPISGAGVSASLTGGSYPYTAEAESASDGSYTISGLPPGNYTVYATAAGYVHEYYLGAYSYSNATPVAVKDSAITSGIDFTLDIGGSISGHVYQADGVTPISDAYLYASFIGLPYTYSGSAFTGSDGSYNISQLPAGNYIVEAHAFGYISEYYDSTRNYSEAAMVLVTPPINTPDIVFTLYAGGAISGHVYLADGVTPVSGADVSAYLSGATYSNHKKTTSAPDGSYTLSQLPPGKYFISASVSDGPFYYYENYNTSVSVAGDNISGVDFALDIGCISGHVYQADGVTPISGAYLEANLNQASYPYSAGATSASDGTYCVLCLPEGYYRLQVWAEGYLEEYYDGTYDYVQSKLVPVPKSTSVSGIDFTLNIGGTIAGHVYMGDGVTPVSGADVYASLIGDSSSDDVVAITGSEGSYKISDLPPGKYKVWVETDYYPTEYYDNADSYSKATPVAVKNHEISVIDFVLNTGGSISGHVYQADGITPIADAEVYADGVEEYDYENAVTADDGSYTLRGLDSDSYLVYVEAEGYLNTYYNGVFDEDEATPVEVTFAQDTPNINFALSSGGSISGHVYQADGITPVPDAEVYADGNYTRESVVTADDGSYTIQTLYSGNYEVYVRASGYLFTYYDGVYDDSAATLVNVISPQNTPNIDFALEIGGSISGHVYQADGVTPIKNAHIYASLQGEDYGYSHSGSDGSYLISGLVPGNFRVRVTANNYFPEYYDDAYSPGEAILVPVTLSNTTSNIDFTLGTGGSISGHVYQMDGTTPIVGVKVYADGDEYSEWATTSDDGSYTIRLLGSGSYQVYVEASGYLTTYYNGVYDDTDATMVEVTAPQDTPNIDFALSIGGSISGHVYQADGITPIEEAEIYASLQGKSYSYNRTVYSHSDGSYLVSTLVPGNYVVKARISKDPYQYYDHTSNSSKATPVAIADQTAISGIDFILDIGGSISGHVYQADGITPVDSARVYAEGSYSDESAVTADDGSYTIRVLYSGKYQVYVQASAYLTTYYNGVYNDSKSTKVSVTAPQDTPNINFTLNTGGSISGHVYQADGNTPIEDAEIYASLQGKGYSYSRTVYSHSEGSYLISMLQPGNYQLRITVDGYLEEYYQDAYDSDDATLVPVALSIDTPNINFTLDTGGCISGHIYQADGVTPIEHAEIYASLQGKDYSYSQFDYSDSDGSYLISMLQPGNYKVRVTADDYFPEYYDSAYDSGEASLVPVTLSNNTSNIDFTLGTGGSISGYVYRPDGITPISYAEVYIKGDHTFESAATTDDGSYTLQLLGTGSYLVYAEASKYLTTYYNGVYDDSEATKVNVTFPLDTPNIDFTLSTGGSISGHIYQADGVTPIKNARVYASLQGKDYSYSRTAYSAFNGSYLISRLVPGNYWIAVQADGYIQEYYIGEYTSREATPVAVVGSDKTSGIDITLSTGGSISGYVYREDGVTPISDASISASLTGDDYSYWRDAETSVDGSYSISRLPSGSYIVRASASGYIGEYYNGVYDAVQITPVSVTDPADTSGIDFTLDKGGSISGHVYQADGVTPIKGSRVYASLQGEGYSDGQSAYSASDGSYLISRLSPGNYRVEVSSSNFIPEYYNGTYNTAEATPVPVTMANITPDIDFTLDTGGSISGYVYQADGRTPLYEAKVSASLQLADYQYSNDAQTDFIGRYTVTHLPPGNYTVRIEAPDYLSQYYAGASELESATLVPVIDLQDTPGINFSLDTGGSISGHVYQTDGITPVRGARVSASSAGTSSAVDYSASDGSYTISNLMPGYYHLEVTAEGYIHEYYNGVYKEGLASLVPVALSDNTPDIDFTLDTGGSISGHVYRADGSTPFLNRADIYIQSVSGDKVGNSYTLDGSYTVRGFPSGIYKVLVQAEGYPAQYYNGAFNSKQAAFVYVTAPCDTPGIDINLKKGGSISGHIYQADGSTPVSGVHLSTITPGTSSAHSGEGNSASDGSYSIGGLYPGVYQVLAVAPGYIPEYHGGAYSSSEGTPVSVIVSADTAGIDFSLDSGAAISGHVYRPDGVTPIAGADVGVEVAGKNINFVTTSFDGSYTLSGLPSGNYLVYAYAYGYLSEYYNDAYYSDQATPVNVTAPEATSNIDFALEKGGSISGHVYQADGITPVTSKYAYALPTVLGSRPRVAGPMPAEPTLSPGIYLSNNRFKIKDLPPGEYRVQISASGYLSEYYAGALFPEDATLVTVSSGIETPDINFTLDIGGSISGHVYQSDGTTPIRGATVSANLAGATVSDNLTAPSDNRYMETITDYEGSYTLRGLTSGSYKIRVQAKGYVSEYYSDVYLSEEAFLVSVVVPDNTPGIDFSLERRGDANKDGKVNMGDVTRVELIILGLAESTPLADSNGDGKINMGDVTRIELDILGI